MKCINKRFEYRMLSCDQIVTQISNITFEDGSSCEKGRKYLVKFFKDKVLLSQYESAPNWHIETNSIDYDYFEIDHDKTLELTLYKYDKDKLEDHYKQIKILENKLAEKRTTICFNFDDGADFSGIYKNSGQLYVNMALMGIEMIWEGEDGCRGEHTFSAPLFLYSAEELRAILDIFTADPSK